MLDNLTAAREQMAFSLGFHIIFAVFGMGLPWLLLYAEGRWLRTGDPLWYVLARRWSRAFAVLFAVGAVSGTVLSFEFGLLWPTFMERYGGVFGLAFTLEAFAFFLEAIFLGLYLYGWDRLPARWHWWTGVPVALSGMASAGFVTTANAWMNTPVGFTEVNGVVVSADPLAPLLAPATPHQVVHMVLAALMCTGFGVAAVYATAMLRDPAKRADPYHRRGLGLGLALAAAVTPLQLVVGDWAIRAVADRQPVKLAALEALHRTGPDAALAVGPVELPGVLSFLLHGRTDAVVTGLDAVPPADRPPVGITHYSFDLMVAIGLGLLALSAWAAWRWRYRRADCFAAPWFLRALAAAGPASVVALIAGWIATEVGRQPWIVHLRLRTADAVATAPRLEWYLYATLAIYAVLATSLVAILRRLARTPIETRRPAGVSGPAGVRRTPAGVRR
ncbi:cytochrome ubiquinol oxidase subunit I [Pilimelia anulata]|uniref:Cytochrome ubiquinol oxidase subunit I n=1 Tax=Pilimelia anulata TaxID=53371 RepID=A0A8J3FD22_9ACTN|nr:cytochrome ubiquinol oxidase subunit I [Pilimelia anulata]GGJ94262.1 cytochrome ubiquinol oxidase subunit I [Pilimelia anulata]